MAARPSFETPPGASLVGNVRHDLRHLHGLARRHLLNADDDLVVRRARRVLEQFPEALQQAALVARRPAASNEQRKGRGCRSLPRREAAAGWIVLKDDMD